LGTIAGQGLQGLGAGLGELGAAQSEQRFALLRDALKGERDKRTVWDAILGLLQQGGQAAGAAYGAGAGGGGGLGALDEGAPMTGQGAGNVWTASAENPSAALASTDPMSARLRRLRRGYNPYQVGWQG